MKYLVAAIVGFTVGWITESLLACALAGFVVAVVINAFSYTTKED